MNKIEVAERKGKVTLHLSIIFHTSFLFPYLQSSFKSFGEYCKQI